MRAASASTAGACVYMCVRVCVCVCATLDENEEFIEFIVAPTYVVSSHSVVAPTVVDLVVAPLGADGVTPLLSPPPSPPTSDGRCG